MQFRYSKERPHYSGRTLKKMSVDERATVLNTIRIARANEVYHFICSKNVNHEEWFPVSSRAVAEGIHTTRMHVKDAYDDLIADNRIKMRHGEGNKPNYFHIV